MEMKTEVGNWTGSSLCATHLETGPCVEILAPVLLAAFEGRLTGCDIAIPENLPVKVSKSYLIQKVP